MVLITPSLTRPHSPRQLITSCSGVNDGRKRSKKGGEGRGGGGGGAVGGDHLAESVQASARCT